MSEPLEVLQKKLGVRFKNQSLLQHALTHTSYIHENKLPTDQSNERLEFLGDAVLGICIAEMLIRAFPDEPEGALSKRRAALVNQKQVARLAEAIDLGPALRLGKGEEKTGGRTKSSLLGDAFEAMIGAMYLDQGLEVVQPFLQNLFKELIPVSKTVETSQDYKTRLQEFYQKEFKRSPRYVVVNESGPDHSKIFEVRIDFQGSSLGEGKGRSKREAEQDAARHAIVKLGPIETTGSKKKNLNRKKRKASAKAKETKEGDLTSETKTSRGVS